MRSPHQLAGPRNDYQWLGQLLGAGWSQGHPQEASDGRTAPTPTPTPTQISKLSTLLLFTLVFCLSFLVKELYINFFFLIIFPTTQDSNIIFFFFYSFFSTKTQNSSIYFLLFASIYCFHLFPSKNLSIVRFRLICFPIFFLLRNKLSSGFLVFLYFVLEVSSLVILHLSSTSLFSCLYIILQAIT